MEEYIAGLDLSPYIEGEIWKDIPNYEGYYQVSNIGRVRSLDRVAINSLGRKYYYKGKILRQVFTKFKYFRIELNKSGYSRAYFTHVLVAIAFIPNPNNFPVVNHKDEKPSNNKVENLEWCTIKYNTNYGTAIQRRSKTISLPVVQLTKNNEIVKIYDSGTIAEEKFGYSQGHISLCCVGIEEYSAGYKWVYLKDYKPELTEEEILHYKNVKAPIPENVHKKKIVKLSLDNEFVKQYDKIIEAANEYGAKWGTAIVACCKGRLERAYGYKWMYLEDYEKLLENNRNNT